MQRKRRLIRSLLEYVEREHQGAPVAVPELEGYTDAEVHYHVGLCVEAGYLVADEPMMRMGLRTYGLIHRLTWAGHEALDALRRNGCGAC